MKNKFFRVLSLITGILILLGAVSCSMSSSSSSSAQGSISGSVLYSNLTYESHGGIVVTLDKTDGLVTKAVNQSVISRSLVSSARTVVSSCLTSSDGSYTFSGLEAGVYTIYASSASSAEKAVYTNVVVRSSENTVADVMTLTATGSISGQIKFDENTNEKNIGILVFVAGTSYMAMTDSEGNFTISGVPVDSVYQLVATKNSKFYWLGSSYVKDIKSDEFFSYYVPSDTFESDTASMVWLGSYNSADEISNPEYLNAYFNMSDGCSYIYNGTSWELLARAGEKGEQGEAGTAGANGSDGVSINWLGSFASSEYIDNPQYLDAYYNTTDGCSYIYTSWGGWQLLAQKGEQGEDGTAGANGSDGVSINWLGSYESASEISNPQYLDAYYNTKDGCSYIYNGSSWTLLAKAGTDGVDGSSIVWKGELDSAPTEPEVNWAYYNTSVGYSYIWNGTEWEVLAKAGANGTSIVWKGELSDAPTSPKLYWAYYNTTDGCSYLYNGTEWELLAKSGSDGLAGSNGADGTGITWLGSYASSSKISNPAYLTAYYNTTDGCSYIYNGTEWELLSRKGSDGVSGGSGSGGITWLGDFADDSEISEPEVLSAYYNTTTGCSYIYNGTEWKLLAKGGTDGVDGDGITWLGSLPSDSYITNPQYLYAYYNTTNGCSYIYTGSAWVLLAKTNANGEDFNSSGTTDGMLPINSAYSIGDVLLNDGSVIPYSAGRVFTDEQKSKAVGVMYGNEYDIPCGWLGIYNSCGGTGSGSYQWAPSGTTGNSTCFEDIMCKISYTTDVTTATFDGDTDGSDNWTYIKSQDSTGANNPATNYPAFYYVNQYASRFYFTGTSYSSGWYMPSLAELCFIYRNKTILNSVLSALGGIQLKDVDYWASTQNNTWDSQARYVDFSNGTATGGIYDGGKDQYKRVCVVRPLVPDTTAPSSVSNLTATYNISTKAITVSWRNPYASDLAYVTVSYTKGGTAIISNAPVFGSVGADSSYTVYNVEPDGDEYVFTIVAVDTVGNTSTATTKKITPTNVPPEFTEFNIPTVNYLKEGNTVIATITGKNFNTTEATQFTATCASKPLIVSNTSFEIQSDTLITASFTITGKIGEYDITVSYGESEITGTLKVQDFGTYTDGDVLLNDGTIVPYNANSLTFTDEQKANAVGVLYCDDYGVPKGYLGIHNSYGGTNSGTYKWAKSDSLGYATKFTDLVCTSFSHSNRYTIFAGDTDGSDNWAYICDMYPVETSNAEENYPAFNYVNNYASTFSLTGDYAEGWYMPSIAELYYVLEFERRTILNTVLSALDGTRLATDCYWSSSQNEDYSYCVVSYSSRIIKNYTSYYVCVVRPFN